MGLGNNRDYSTTDRRVRTNLAIHFARMNELIGQGMGREAASKRAAEEQKDGTLPSCKCGNGKVCAYCRKKKAKAVQPPPTHVLYAADQNGYTVRIMRASDTIEEYNGGNYEGESTSWVDPKEPFAVPVEKLHRDARETAVELAKEHELTDEHVNESADLLPLYDTEHHG